MGFTFFTVSSQNCFVLLFCPFLLGSLFSSGLSERPIFSLTENVSVALG